MQTKDTNINKLFFKYVFASVISMIGLSCYILADTIFIARGMGNNGLTALNLVLPIYSIINGIGLMLGMGGAIRYSILRGMGDYKKANKTFTQTIYLALGFGGLVTSIGVLFSKEIVELLGADAVIMPMAKVYLRTMMLFSGAFMVNNVLICFVRNDNNPKLSMFAMLSGSFSNIIMDYIFIFPLNLGMFGAAFATGFAPIVSMCVLSLHFIRKKNQFKLVKTPLQKNQVKKVVSLGLPSLITELSWGIIMLLFNMVVLRISGNIGVAAYGIIANLALIVGAIFTGIAQGIQPILSMNYSIGNHDNVKKVFRYAMILAFCMGVGVYLVGFVYPDAIIRLFNKEQNEVLTVMAIKGMKLYFVSFLFMGLNIVTASYFASINQSAKAFTLSLARGFVFVIPVIFLLSYYMDMTGVWLAIPVAEGLTLLVSILFVKGRISRLM